MPGPQAARTGEGVRCTSHWGATTGITRFSSPDRVLGVDEGTGVSDWDGVAVVPLEVGSVVDVGEVPRPHPRATITTIPRVARVLIERRSTVYSPPHACSVVVLP